MHHVLSLATLFPNPVNPRFGTFVARSLEALAKRGDWQVTVVNPVGIPPIPVGRYRALSQLDTFAVENGIAVYRPRFTLIPKVGARRNASAIVKATLPKIRDIHAKHPIDLIDAQFFFPDGPAAAMVAEALNLPLSIKARGSDISFWSGHDFARKQMAEAAQQADGLLAVSSDLRRQMEALGMDGSKIRVHYTGLDRDRFRPLNHTGLRAQLGQEIGFDMPKSSPLLVTVGALIDRKGQDIAIATLPSLPDARLLLVGQGEKEAELRGLARELGVAERVHFAGSIDHDLLPIVLSAADAMVLPTETEGLANAWVEALACGTPVITTDVGGARELITTDAAGRLVDRNAEAFAAGIRSVLSNPHKRQDVAQLVEQFSWETNASQLAEYYQQLIAN
ncbi:MAG: glycosyltransferase [Pseudomonadota bacterium]